MQERRLLGLFSESLAVSRLGSVQASGAMKGGRSGKSRRRGHGGSKLGVKYDRRRDYPTWPRWRRFNRSSAPAWLAITVLLRSPFARRTSRTPIGRPEAGGGDHRLCP